MTCRPLSSKDCYSYRESRLNQQIRCETTGEGCSVIEESGTVCGETNTLSILKEFRQIYDDCLKKLEGFPDGSATLRKLAPFTKLIEDLWEQNTMLVETVEELEQEASNRVTNLQDKLNKSCQKIKDYEEDVASLIKVVRCFSESGEIDLTGCNERCSRKSSVSLSELKRLKNKELRASNNSSSLLPAITESKCCNISDVLCRDSSSKKFKSELEVENINSKKFINLKKSKYFIEPLRRNSKCEGFDDSLGCFDNCKYNCNGTFLNVSQIEDPVYEDDKYGQCLRSININFNIGSDSKDNCDCGCNCSNSEN